MTTPLRLASPIAATLMMIGLVACAAQADRAQERDCRGGMDRLDQAIAAWQGSINAKTQAENDYDLADGAADFGQWRLCLRAVERGLRALG